MIIIGDNRRQDGVRNHSIYISNLQKCEFSVIHLNVIAYHFGGCIDFYKKTHIVVFQTKLFLKCFFIFFIQGDFEVTVNLACDTITSLRLKLANESGIPAHVLYYK